MAKYREVFLSPETPFGKGQFTMVLTNDMNHMLMSKYSNVSGLRQPIRFSAIRLPSTPKKKRAVAIHLGDSMVGKENAKP